MIYQRCFSKILESTEYTEVMYLHPYLITIQKSILDRSRNNKFSKDNREDYLHDIRVGKNFLVSTKKQ